MDADTPAQRVNLARRNTLVPYLDGRSLLDILAEYEVLQGYRHIVGGRVGGPSNGPLTGEGLPLSTEYEGLRVSWFPEDRGSARIDILGCVCGSDECWPISLTVTVTEQSVTWSDFRQGRRPDWDYSGLGPFRFSRNTYQKALIELLESEGATLYSSSDLPLELTVFLKDPVMKVHALYIANRAGAEWSPADKNELFSMVSAVFPGFTVTEALGYFEGRPLATLVVQVATNLSGAVRDLGEQIRVRFQQQAVGLTVDGRYLRLTGSEDATT